MVTSETTAAPDIFLRERGSIEKGRGYLDLLLFVFTPLHILLPDLVHHHTSLHLKIGEEE
jgi:hypothetical protein